MKATTFMPLTSMKHATENCDFVNVVLTRVPDSRGSPRHCWAMVPQRKSAGFHVYRYGRVEPVHRKATKLIDPTAPLRLIGRGVQWFDGHDAFRLGSHNELRSVQPAWQALQLYTKHLTTVQQQVSILIQTKLTLHDANDNNNSNSKRTAAAAAAVGTGGVVVGLTCNWGQAELLTNFVCAARARNLSLTHVLVFALDADTAELCTQLGIASYYNADLFGHMPQSEGPYGGAKFAIIAMAKFWVPHILSSLGYDFLFQDVDVVWYCNLLPFFVSRQQEHDMIFIDDGSRQPHMAPFYANTGFYFVFNNDRTRNFFNRLVAFGGETILRHNCDQLATNILLPEHVSVYGLKVKVISRSWLEFLSGYHFRRLGHKRRDVQQLLLAPTAAQNNNNNNTNTLPRPYMFHACWNSNKKDKLKMFQQIGEWRVLQNEACPLPHQRFCCSAQPVGVGCYMPGYPSVVPCQKKMTLTAKNS
jgi:hypothetical protein